MPQTRHYSTPELGIQTPGSTISPGDTIHGTISRAAHIVAPRALVTISLHGRSKTKIELSTGPDHATTTYRAAFNFFNPAATTQVLFNGPLHVERGADHAAWHFALTIPRTVDTGALISSCSPKASYECIGTPDRALPESFAFSHRGALGSFEGYVEYYLQATLQVYSNKPVRAQVATLPLFIRTPSPEPPIAYFMPHVQRIDRRRYRPYKFLSHRLVPGPEDIKPSLLQKAQRLLHWKSVPVLGVEFEVEAPRVVQLEHPAPMRFCIRAIPDWERTSGVIHGVPQLIRLDSVSLRIVARTDVLCMGTLNPRHVSVKHSAPLSGYTNVEGRERYLPFSPYDPPLDVGDLTDLRVGYGGSIGGTSAGAERLCPAFTAFNIRHGGHTLHWCIRVSLAGEKKKIYGSQPVEILPASESDWSIFSLPGESLIGRSSELSPTDDGSSDYSSFYSGPRTPTMRPLLSGARETESEDTSPLKMGVPPPYWSAIKPEGNSRHAI